MKKTLSLLLAGLMLFGVCTAFSFACAAEASDPAPVKNDTEFLAMDPDGSYYLASDILLDSSYVGVFSGSLDGRGRTVTVSRGAMFEQVKDADIANFTVRGNIETTAKGYAVGKNDFAAGVAVVANGSSSFRNIISEVEFKTTSTNTRYGAIAATSDEGYALTFENCINRGNISVVKHAGGIYAWSDKLGETVFSGCVNLGNITAQGYCGGMLARASAESSGVHTTFLNCVNKGDITSTKEYCGGLLAYTNSYVHAERCVNLGNITAKGSHAAGLLANLANPGGNEGIHMVEYNVNCGNITSESSGGYVGGIVGYVYGKVAAYAVINANVNLGLVRGNSYCSQIIAYTNSNSTRITNNVGAGRLLGNDRDRAVMVGMSSATATKYDISGNIFIENDGTVTYTYANDNKYASNRIALKDRPAGSITFASAEQFKNGEVAELINNALVSNTFEVRGGQTTVMCRHEYPVIDGECAACGEEFAPPAEDTTEPFAETEAPEDTEPVTSTEAPEDTEPVDGGKSCGGVSVLPTFIALICTAAIALFKRKY